MVDIEWTLIWNIHQVAVMVGVDAFMIVNEKEARDISRPARVNRSPQLALRRPLEVVV